MSRSLLLALATLLLAAGALADDPLDFGKSPAKWLMNAAEQRQWREVRTPEAAREFVDLFWARRDPTPGTPANEFEMEFLRRVAFADGAFNEPSTRGALTERGRALIVLGFPSNMNYAAAKYQKQESGGNDITGGHRLAGRDVWLWTHDDAKKLFGMPKVEIVFLLDDLGYAKRDTQRGDFLGALDAAIRKSIVTPNLTAVPDWGRPQSGMHPSSIAVNVVREEDLVQTMKTAGLPLPASAGTRPVAKPKGAGKLALVRDAFAVEAQTGRDPFDGLASLDSFRKGDELGFVAEYCAGVILEELTGVTMQMKISGIVNNEKINMTAPAEELIPDSIKASPGCHLVRGSVPLQDVDPGQYTLTLTIAAGADNYNLTREFRVE